MASSLLVDRWLSWGGMVRHLCLCLLMCQIAYARQLVEIPELQPFVFGHDGARGPNSTSPSDTYGPPPTYFEESYSTGWFSTPSILNARVQPAQLYQIIMQRQRSHYPAFITAHTTSGPPSPAEAFFNLLWLPNANKMAWVLAYNLDGVALQQQINKQTSAGLKPYQIESYSYWGHSGDILYAAIFYDASRWAADVKFEAVFGVPHDDRYCCGPSSRWTSLQRAGYRPLSIALVQDPISSAMFVADVWNSDQSADYWQAGFDKTSGQLQSMFSSLSPPLTPVFVKAYTYRTPTSTQVFYSYIVQSSTATQKVSLTTALSRSGFELLAVTFQVPPLFVSTHFNPEAADPGSDITSGDIYAALWQFK